MEIIKSKKYDWQYPAITEKYAYENIIKDKILSAKRFIYVAYPWATIIDEFHKETKDRTEELLEKFVLENCDLNPFNDDIVVTVCQSYNYKKFLPVFSKLNINVVFCPHASKKDYSYNLLKYNIKVLPFPLYPVNTIKPIEKKDIHYSFIGCINYTGTNLDSSARATQLRTTLVKTVTHQSNTLVQAIDEWHFNKVVYKKQIYGQELSESEIKDEQKRADNYTKTLARSRYSLCPRGIGPSSIRFWESLCAGAIPVVIADDLWLPEIESINWEECILSIREKDIERVPDIIKSVNQVQEQKMRDKCINAFAQVYGSGFISPIKKFLNTATDKNKFSLFIPFYRVTDKNRLDEFLFCIEKNLSNAYLDHIFILYEYSNKSIKFHYDNLPVLLKNNDKITIKFAYRPKSRNLSYLDFIKYANSELGINRKFIIANSDIFFDDSLNEIVNLDLDSTIFALTRYNYKNYKNFLGNSWKRNMYSQDSWFLKTKFPENSRLDLNLGWIGCDNVIAYEFDRMGYKVLNISESIKSWHVHNNTDQRHLYTNGFSYKYSGKPYKFLPMIRLEQIFDSNFTYDKLPETDRQSLELLIKKYKEEIERHAKFSNFDIGSSEY